MSEKPALPDDLVAEIDRLAPQLTLLDHYAILGVSEVSSPDEIKNAYLRLIKRFHPDRWHARDSGAHRKRMEAIFARATEAYEVLKSPVTKLEYDRSLYEIRGIPRPSSLPRAAPAPIRPPTMPSPPPVRDSRKAPSVNQMAKAVRLMDQLRSASPAVPPPAGRPGVPAAPIARAAPPVPKEPAKAGPPRPGIVVVEDDDALRKMLVRIFQDVGEVREARDGLEALKLLEADPIPRLVVTDVMMPNMDGLELAKRMKATPRTARIPIVMLTAKQGPRDLIDGVNAGARVYVTKPFKVDDLKAKALKAMGPV